MQGLRGAVHSTATDVGLGMMKGAFPNGQFPLEAVHEFCCAGNEQMAASAGFVSGILSPVMCNGGATLWVSSSHQVFAPALVQFGIEPHHVLFVRQKKEKEVLWAVEEALKCSSLAAVVGELPELSFTASRRLQLAVEENGVPCFLLRNRPKNLSTSSVSRWSVQPLPGAHEDGLPGLSAPRWKVELLKIRNGHPGSWVLEWDGNRLRPVYPQAAVVTTPLQKKTG